MLPTDHVIRPTDHRLWYLASPYSKTVSPERAFKDLAALAGALALKGYPILPPILIGHPMAWHGSAPAVNHSWWMRFNAPLMAACDAMLIAMMDGWKKSAGIRDEIAFFRSAGRPIYYLNPNDMRITRERE